MENPELVLTNFSRYQDNPHLFGEEVFGEHYTEDVIKVMESVRDNPVTIAKSGNAVGKSHGAARIAVWFYKSFPGAQVYTTAAPPEKNLYKILWGEINSLVGKKPDVFSTDRITLDLNIQCSPLSFLTGVAIPSSGTPEQRQAKFSGKHAPYLLFIVDEGDAVPVEVYKGIESCMSGGHARLLIMFNPRAEYGPVAQMEKNKQGHVVNLSALNHPNVVTGKDIIPGAVTREVTVRRINEWTRPLLPDEHPDNETFQVPDYLVGATAVSKAGMLYSPLPAGHRKVLPDGAAFFYMVLGEYPPQGETQLIARAWIEAAVSRYHTYIATYGEKSPTDSGIVGLDISEYGKDWNVLTFRIGGYVPPQTRWQGIDPDMTASKAFGICNQTGYSLRVMVDGTGVGAGVAPKMSRLGIPSVSVKVASSPTIKTELGEFLILRDQLWWSVREWLRTDPGAMLPPDDELIEELAAPMYSIKGGKIRVTDKDTMREFLGRSPDKADSLCLTFAEGAVSGYVEVGVNPLDEWRG
jgi:hypothetical protein